MTEIHFDHHAPDFKEHSAEIYSRLRRDCPVARSSSYGGFWVVSRYEDVASAARDQETFSSAFSVVLPPTDVGALPPLEVDSPELDRYRRMLAPFLNTHAVRRIAPTIEAAADDAINRFVGRGHAELVSEYFNPVPAIATMELLGLSTTDWHVFAGPLHAASYSPPGSEAFQNAIDDIAAFGERIETEVDNRIRAPRNDMISALLSTDVDGRRATRAEVIGLVRMVIFGGMDTVSATMSNVFVHLGRRPDHLHRLTSEPHLISKGTEEILRLEPPIHGFARKVRRPCTLGDQQLEQGDVVFLLWSSANRDDAVFEQPDTVVLDRSPNRHLSFGTGPHFCLGATLAREEMRCMLERFLRRLPRFRLVDAEVIPAATIGIANGWASVGVEFDPSQ